MRICILVFVPDVQCIIANVCRMGMERIKHKCAKTMLFYNQKIYSLFESSFNQLLKGIKENNSLSSIITDVENKLRSDLYQPKHLTLERLLDALKTTWTTMTVNIQNIKDIISSSPKKDAVSKLRQDEYSILFQEIDIDKAYITIENIENIDKELSTLLIFYKLLDNTSISADLYIEFDPKIKDNQLFPEKIRGIKEQLNVKDSDYYKTIYDELKKIQDALKKELDNKEKLEQEILFYDYTRSADESYNVRLKNIDHATKTTKRMQVLSVSENIFT